MTEKELITSTIDRYTELQQIKRSSMGVSLPIPKGAVAKYRMQTRYAPADTGHILDIS